MPRESVVGDGLRVNLREDDIRTIRISCEMLRPKVNARGWRRFHMINDGDIKCVWDAESNLKGV